MPLLRLSKLLRHVQSLQPANLFQLLILCTHAPTVLILLKLMRRRKRKCKRLLRRSLLKNPRQDRTKKIPRNKRWPRRRKRRPTPKRLQRKKRKRRKLLLKKLKPKQPRPKKLRPKPQESERQRQKKQRRQQRRERQRWRRQKRKPQQGRHKNRRQRIKQTQKLSRLCPKLRVLTRRMRTMRSTMTPSKPSLLLKKLPKRLGKLNIGRRKKLREKHRSRGNVRKKKLTRQT